MLKTNKIKKNAIFEDNKNQKIAKFFSKIVYGTKNTLKLLPQVTVIFRDFL